MWALPQLQGAGAPLHSGVQASHCAGFPCGGARTLEHRLSSCDTWAKLLCGMWDLPRSETEPLSPSLAGGFFTTEKPGKPKDLNFNGVPFLHARHPLHSIFKVLYILKVYRSCYILIILHI